MNELKPEDVMRALDILDKMDFFQGQRAGRELWNEKPFEVQEQDIADFSQGIEFVKNLITNALALLREKDALIKDLKDNTEVITEMIEMLNNVIEEKDAEIERLTIELKAMRGAANSYKIYYEGGIKIEGHHDPVGEKGECGLKQQCRAEAITEFAEKIKTYYHNLPGKTVGGSVEYHIDQVLKEMKGE